MTDIFLSYTERDRETARQLAEILDATGWRVWWDRRIPAGETWRSVLEHALADMRCMVVLWSAKSIESEWVYEEASEGRRLSKLVPVMIEPVRPPAGFREIQAADLTGWDGSRDFEGLRTLLSDLENMLGKPAASQTDDSASAMRPPAGQTAEKDHRDAPYGTTELPGYLTPTPQKPKPRWPTWALAGGLLVAVAGIGLSLRQPPVPITPDPKAVSPKPELIVPAPSSTSIPATTPPATHTRAEISRDSRAALETAKPAPTRNTPQPEYPTPIKHPDSTRLSTARCANLLASIQLGETLSEASQSRLDKECRQ